MQSVNAMLDSNGTGAVSAVASNDRDAEVILVFTDFSPVSMDECDLTVLPASLLSVERRARLHEILSKAVHYAKEVDAEILRCDMEQREANGGMDRIDVPLNLDGVTAAAAIDISIVRTTASVYEVWRAANDAVFTLALGVQQATYYDPCYRTPRSAQRLARMERDLRAVMTQLVMSAQHCRCRISLANVPATFAEALDFCDQWLASTQGQQA